MPRRLSLALALMAYGIYIIVPTPDELIIHPVAGFMLARAFNVNVQMGVLLSVGFYNCMGLVMLGASLALGGRMVVDRMALTVAQQGSQLRLLFSRSLTGAAGAEAKAIRSEGSLVLAGSSLDLFD